VKNPPNRFPYRIESSSGLRAQFNANGTLRRLDYRDIILSLFPASELEAGLTNIYLRRLSDSMEATPLLGPCSPGRFHVNEKEYASQGDWSGLGFRCELRLAATAPAWFWLVTIENRGTAPVTVDLIHTQDLALAPYGAIRLNEYYVSQYLDHAPLAHPRQGWVVATRQNQPVGGNHPWCLVGTLGVGASFATDALQFHGLSAREGCRADGLAKGLPGSRLQHEQALTAIQHAPLTLAPGEKVETGFFGWLEAHHPEASSEADLVKVDEVLALPERLAGHAQVPADADWHDPGRSLFTTSIPLAVRDLDEDEIAALFGAERREEERSEAGLLSFFTGQRGHVVLKAKELDVLRPHGHILRTGATLLPDESVLTSTVWMDGVFHSMVTQGHVSINRFLSTTHGYLGLFRSHGQRIFVETEQGWQRLDMPSAFEMTPERCRWLYRHEGGLLEVISGAGLDRHALTLELIVREGPPIRCLISLHVALNGDDGIEAHPVLFETEGAGVKVRAMADSDVGRRFPDGSFHIQPLPGSVIEHIGRDDLLFEDGVSRDQPYLCLMMAPSRMLGLTITGHLVPAARLPSLTADAYWREATTGLALSEAAPEVVRRMPEIMPWFAHNALIHFLAPRGLEQYSGGGWGTRDVTQGPMELLLSIGQFAPIRDLLLRVFRQQNPDGDWPQWFMFYERERGIRPGDSHGDIVYWPLLALAQYLNATGDATILQENLPFFHSDPAQGEECSVWRHVEQALELIQGRVISDTRLAAYGHGDWNDSLQPADPALRERLCSTWTVTLHYQMLTTLAQALGAVGQAEPAGILEDMADKVLADFRQYLLIDGVLAGYAYFEEDGGIDYLLHPRDRKTGLTYSLLPMIHAVINDMLAPDEARRHLDLIRQHLHGPDGAHLFDRPMAYRGGPMTLFQRAESSSFFGREIGNMYMHAHLRYAEALWRFGDSEAFLDALSRAVPIGIQSIVPSATRRQANCYYSSTDAAFPDRYRAHDEYDKALKGEIPLEGGWRVYSSGAGISTTLILRCLLGIRRARATLVIDPVLAPALDGLRVETDLAGHRFDITYRVAARGYGPVKLELNGTPLPFRRLPNPYRTGGAEISMPLLREALVDGVNWLTISLE
jgi:cellobiose phosphorylase